jgi:hypothetical protein
MRLTRVVRLLAAGYLLLGVSHIALLPPWEGFDESAHYSYIQELADTGSVPRMETARISADVERYRDAPLPYASRPPFESNGALTYRTFFAGGPDRVGRGEALVHRRPEAPRRYVPGPVRNWQAQHPPLYYVVLAPLYRATRAVSWGAHLFALRLASFLLAWTAWALAVAGCLNATAARQDAFPWRWATLGTAVWPMFWPGWFPEFARLGNDSLAALLATAVWLLTVRAVRGGLATGLALSIGVLLGVGSLTKLPFVALAAGLTAFWLVRAATTGGTREMAGIGARLTMILGVTAAIAGWWYVRARYPYVIALWPGEVAALREAGGLVGGLARNLTAPAWLRGQATLLVTVAWSGTWSLARPPHVVLAPLALTVLLAALGYLAALRRFRPGELAWAPLWMAAFLVAGLEYHALVRIALTGNAITPGYYLHILLAPLGAALGLALQRACSRALWRRVMLVLGGYALVFALVVSWAQVLMFSGHVFKAGANRFYQAGSPWPALLDAPEVLGRMNALAFPAAGAATFIAGAVLVAMGGVSAWTIARTGAPDPPRT